MKKRVSFRDVLIKAIQDDKVKVISVNRSMMEVSKEIQGESGFVKVAIDDNSAEGYINRKLAGFLLTADGDELNRIADKLAEDKAND